MKGAVSAHRVRALSRRIGPATTIAAATAFAVLATLASGAHAFDLEGHRGARGLRPENTLAAFAYASALGVSTLEMDLAVTRDGVLVIAHDPYLNPDLVRGPDGRWLAAKGPAIRQQSLDDLRRYDVGRLNPDSRYAKLFPLQQPVDGERFPTLVEVFDLVRTSGKPLRLNLETKITPAGADETVDPETFARLVTDAVRGAKFESRVTIQSFDWRTLVALKRRAPEIGTACLTSETDSMDTVQRKSAAPSPWLAGHDIAQHGGSLPRLVKEAGCGTWSPFWRNVTPALVAEAAALGLKVLPWTVNDPADMARLIDMKVDGLITDYPDRLRMVMTDKGLPLP